MIKTQIFADQKNGNPPVIMNTSFNSSLVQPFFNMYLKNKKINISQEKRFRRRKSNPGLLRERQKSYLLDHIGLCSLSECISSRTQQFFDMPKKKMKDEYFARKKLPTTGIEPGPPVRKVEILTTRARRSMINV